MNKTKKGLMTDYSKKLWFSALINAGILLFFLLIFRPFYETNDDIGILAFAGGAKDVFDAHLVYVNYLYGLLLSSLYRIWQYFPWYVVLQYILLYLAFTMVFYVAGKHISGSAGIWASLIVILFFAYEGYVKIQYTKTAGIISAAGVFVVLYAVSLQKICWKELIAGYLLCCFGILLRRDQFLAEEALLSAAGIALLLKLRGTDKKTVMKYLERYGVMCAVWLLILVGLTAADKKAYSAPEWQEYMEYNELRTELLDYGFPSYEENKEVYEELGIDKSAFRLYSSWNFADPDKFTIDVMKQLVDLKTPRAWSGTLLKNFLKTIPPGILDIPCFYCFLVIFFMKLFITGIKKKDIPVLIWELGMGTALYLYLFYQGRYLYNRVDVGIWFAAVLVLLWIFSDGSVESEKSTLSFRNGMALVLAVLCICQITWKSNWKIKTKDSAEAMQGRRAAIETIHQDQDHLYLAKSGTVSVAKSYSALSPIPAGILNNIYGMGGWNAATPVFLSTLKRYGIENPYRDVIGNEKIFLIDDNIELTMKYIKRYYNKRAEAVQVSEIGNMKIYQVVADDKNEKQN